MAQMQYEDVRDRLTPEAMALFREMVDAHLAAGSGDRLFIRTDSAAGSSLLFSGGGAGRSWGDLDVGALNDLGDYGLLRREYGTRGNEMYRINGESLAFHKWLMESDGAPIEQVVNTLHGFADGPEFAARHPGAAHHLGEAFELLWSGRTDDQTVSELGDHLRKVLMDLTHDVVGDSDRGDREKPIERLQSRMATAGLGDRESAVLVQLVELARVTLRLDHRLNHVRDEHDRRRPAPTWEELRRAAFATAMVAFELSRAFPV